MKTSAETHTCYDVCCGAGLFSYAFELAGFGAIGGIDINKQALGTANANMAGSFEILSLENMAHLVYSTPKHIIFQADTIIAGLPCQGFSVAGKRDPNDKRNQLYRYLLKIVKRVNPKFVIVENVRGLLFARNKTTFDALLKGLGSLGYNVDYRLYDAIAFGTPQRRKRVVVIGSRIIPTRYIFEGVKFSANVATVRSAFAGLPYRRQIKRINHTFMKHSKKVVQRIMRIRNSSIISYRRLQWDNPSLTITSGHNALPLHPGENRAISIREAARLQGIPDTFIFKGSRTQQTVHVANAVPLPMALAIAKAIIGSGQRIRKSRGTLYESLVSKNTPVTSALLSDCLITFYEQRGRAYPWRDTTDPYKLLLTEMLLQRTNSKMVNGIWHRVIGAIRRTSGKTSIDWRIASGAIKKIGLVNRTKTIERMNAYLSTTFENRVPRNYEELMSIPGVGTYMAAALRTFAFDIADFPVDSNAFRFISRFFGVNVRGRKSEALQIREFMNEVIANNRAKEFVYGFLDFCALVCTPKNPNCGQCVLKSRCNYFNIKSAGAITKLPRNGTISEIPTFCGHDLSQSTGTL